MSDNNFQPNLWWVFDSESNTFSTLPTGPFLVPALIFCGLFYFARFLVQKHHTHETIAEDLAETWQWKEKKRRYDELIIKSVETFNNLDFYELAELRQLEAYLSNPHKR